MPRMGKGYLPLLYIPDGAGRYVKLPVLTTTQRNALTGVEGMIIFNSTTDQLEEYDGAVWEAVGQVILTTHAALTIAHGTVDDIADQTDIATHAALFNLHSEVVVKSADQEVTSSETLEDVDDLLIPVAANEVKHFLVEIIHDTHATPDNKLGFSVPSGATLYWNQVSVGYNSNALEAADTYTIPGRGTGTIGIAWLMGVIINGSTAGNLQFRFAQATSSAEATIIKANSSIIATKLP